MSDSHGNASIQGLGGQAGRDVSFPKPISEEHATQTTRLPTNYARIYALVCEQVPGHHRTAHELYVEAHKRFPTMGISTVYRGLARLRDMGLVEEIVVPGGDSAVYERAAPPHTHFHFSSCGDVQDVAYQLPSNVLRRLSRAQANQITDVSVTFHGICRGCASSSAPSGSSP